MNKTDLKNFLYKAHAATFASGDNSSWTKEKDHSNTVTYKDGDWSYHDNFFGGEPYGGREVVFYKQKPVYMMTYYGSIIPSWKDVKQVYVFLQEALRKCPKLRPLRGPDLYIKDSFEYVFYVDGDIDSFLATEIIKADGKPIYLARFIGGLVDQRPE